MIMKCPRYTWRAHKKVVCKVGTSVQIAKTVYKVSLKKINYLNKKRKSTVKSS